MDGQARQGATPNGRLSDGTFAPIKLTAARPPIGRWLTVAVIGLVVAIAKPWAADQPSAGEAGGLAAAVERYGGSSRSPVPTLAPDSAGPLVAAFCLDPESWRVATIERWRDQTIRVWRAIEPLAIASGPNDARIPVFPIVSEGVTELGWCAPVVGPDRPVGLATVEAWQRTPTGSVAIRTTSTRPTGIGLSFGGLYLPPGPPDTELWADGVYVFRYHEPAGRERWFAVEVERRPKPDAIDAVH